MSYFIRVKNRCLTSPRSLLYANVTDQQAVVQKGAKQFPTSQLALSHRTTLSAEV